MTCIRDVYGAANRPFEDALQCPEKPANKEQERLKNQSSIQQYICVPTSTGVGSVAKPNPPPPLPAQPAPPPLPDPKPKPTCQTTLTLHKPSDEILSVSSIKAILNDNERKATVAKLYDVPLPEHNPDASSLPSLPPGRHPPFALGMIIHYFLNDVLPNKFDSKTLQRSGTPDQAKRAEVCERLFKDAGGMPTITILYYLVILKLQG